MPGFSSNTGGLDVVFANNVNFSGTADHPDSVTTNGQLLIGTTALNAGGTHINVGTITSPGNTITIGYSSPNITIDVAGGTIPVEKFQVDTVTAPGVNPVVPTGAGLVTITGIGGTNTFSSATNTISLAAMPQPGWNNLGIALSGTTFTVQGYNGTALSSTNPAVISMQSLANPGRIINYKVTANQTFTQAQLGNNLFGVTTGIDIAQDVPFYLYAVSNANNGENAIAFMISRFPNASSSPVAGKIGQSGNTLASTQGSFFSLATITAADYASSPCLSLGSFRMRYASSLWTVQTLGISDGIGQFQRGIAFSMVPGQFGATSGKYFINNGGTAPIFTTSTAVYIVQWANNSFDLSAVFSTITTGGVGGVVLQFALPFNSGGATLGSSLAVVNNGTINATGSTNVTTSPLQLCQFFVALSTTGGVFSGIDYLKNNNFSGTDLLNFNVHGNIAFI